MFRAPGPVCGIRLGEGWIDAGTLSLTRMPSPTATFWPKPFVPADKPHLSPTEQMLLVALDFANIRDVSERAMFLAQTWVESSGFTRLRENLRYTRPERLMAVFPRLVKDTADAAALVKGGPEAIANRVYARKDLGNVEPGDGWRYIGRGYLQITGRYNYTAAGKSLGLDLVGHPELLEQSGPAARASVWFWLTYVPRHAAQLGDVRRVTLRINAAGEKLGERARRYRDYVQLLRRPEGPTGGQ